MKASEKKQLYETLKQRFESNTKRHMDISWANVKSALEANPHILKVVYHMEETGGEPDVILTTDGKWYFYDCSPESPKGRRSLCYDQKALESRKKNKPAGNARAMAEEIGLALLDESDYKFLQTFGPFDTKTSTWIKTPQSIREKGGALFCDYRYGHTFTYHNGAESYYASRGFRGKIKLKG